MTLIIFFILFMQTSQGGLSQFELPTVEASYDSKLSNDILESGKKWVAFFEKNLKCFNPNLANVYLTNRKHSTENYSLMTTQQYEAQIKENSYLARQKVVYSDLKRIVVETQYRYRNYNHDITLNIYDPPVVWAEMLSLCPKEETVTISGVGFKTAKNNLDKLTSQLPDYNPLVGAESIPAEYFIPMENEANDCQPMSFLTELLYQKADFNPQSSPDSLEDIKDKLSKVWHGEDVTFNGYSSPDKLVFSDGVYSALRDFSANKKDKLVLRASNIKMAFNPSAESQRQLKKEILEGLKTGNWQQILSRTRGQYGLWHAIAIHNFEEVEFNGDKRVILHYYDSLTNPTARHFMTYSEEKGGFFESDAEGNHLYKTQKYLWKNNNFGNR